MSTSADKKFLPEDTITLLNSLLEGNDHPKYIGNYSEGQIKNKEYRLKQKFNNARRLGISPCLMKPHDRQAYEISCRLWDHPKPKPMPMPMTMPAARSEGPGTIRWTDYPRVMKHVAAQGNEALIKKGLQRLGLGALRSFESQWAEIDSEDSALQAKKAQLASSSSSSS